MKKYLAVLAIPVAIFVSACGEGDDASREDAADVPGADVDKTAPYVMAFTNHYPNVESKCDKSGHRIFVTTHDSATGDNVIVLPDPTCPGYVKGEPAIVVPSN